MTIIDRLRAVEKQLSEIWKLLMAARAAGGAGSGPHNVLSGTHIDSTAAAAVRGDIIVADSNPKWKRLAKGSTGEVLQADANDAIWGAVPAHASRHQSGGADSIKLDDLAAPDNNTDLDFSTSKHGLCIKAPNDTTKFLRGDASWQTITGSGANTLKLWTPDALPTSPATQCDHFDDASIAAKWTTFQSAAALTVAESDTFYKFSDTGAGGYIYRGAFQTLPAGDFTMMARVAFQGVIGNYIEMGLMLFEDATNNPNTCKLYTWGFLNGVIARGLKLNNKSSYGGTFGSTTTYTNAPWVRIRRSGTTLYFEWSEDGVGWYQAHSEAQWFTPAEMGVVISNQTAATVNFWFDFFFYKGSNDANMNAFGVLEEYWVT